MKGIFLKFITKQQYFSSGFLQELGKDLPRSSFGHGLLSQYLELDAKLYVTSSMILSHRPHKEMLCIYTTRNISFNDFNAIVNEFSPKVLRCFGPKIDKPDDFYRDYEEFVLPVGFIDIENLHSFLQTLLPCELKRLKL